MYDLESKIKMALIKVINRENSTKDLVTIYLGFGNLTQGYIQDRWRLV